MCNFTNTRRVQNKFLVETVPSVDDMVTKMKTLTGHLAETTNAVTDIMVLVDREKKNIVLNVEKETTLPMYVG